MTDHMRVVDSSFLGSGKTERCAFCNKPWPCPGAADQTPEARYWALRARLVEAANRCQCPGTDCPCWHDAEQSVDKALATYPTIAADLELAAAVRRLWDAPHIVEFTEDTFTIQHPLRCRRSLIDCETNDTARMDGPTMEPGRYLMRDDYGYDSPVPDDWDDGFAAIEEALRDD